MPLILLLVWITICMGTNRNLFCPTVLQKCGRDNNWSLARKWRIPTSRNPNQNSAVQSFGGFFHQIKVRQPRGYKPWSDQAVGWIHICMKWLRTLKSFQKFRTEIKKSKTYGGWCPFQGLSNGTTLMQIQYGWTVPLKNIIKIKVFTWLQGKIVTELLQHLHGCKASKINFLIKTSLFYTNEIHFS